MALRTVNAVCEKRKSVKTIIIGDTTNLTVDINRFRKKYKKVVLKDKDYRTINGLIPGPKAVILVGVNGLIEKLYQKNLFVFLLAQAFFL